jgi:hypothetical protein
MKRKLRIALALTAVICAAIVVIPYGNDDLDARAASLRVGATKEDVRRVLGDARDVAPAGGCFAPFEQWFYGGRLVWEPKFSFSPAHAQLFRRRFADAVVAFDTNDQVVLVFITKRDSK